MRSALTRKSWNTALEMPVRPDHMIEMHDGVIVGVDRDASLVGDGLSVQGDVEAVPLNQYFAPSDKNPLPDRRVIATGCATWRSPFVHPQVPVRQRRPQ